MVTQFEDFTRLQRLTDISRPPLGARETIAWNQGGIWKQLKTSNFYAHRINSGSVNEIHKFKNIFGLLLIS